MRLPWQWMLMINDAHELRKSLASQHVVQQTIEGSVVKDVGLVARKVTWLESPLKEISTKTKFWRKSSTLEEVSPPCSRDVEPKSPQGDSEPFPVYTTNHKSQPLEAPVLINKINYGS